MSSGIELHPDVLTVFNDMKIHSKENADKPKPRCLICKISDDKKEIVIEKMIDKRNPEDQENEYNDIIAELPPKDGRYIVWDLKVPNPRSEELNDKLIFMSWSPDDAPIKARMLFAASKDNIKKKLLGIGTAVACACFDDCKYSEVVK